MNLCGQFKLRGNSRIRETGEHLFHDVAVFQVIEDVCLGSLLEGWYVVLGPVNKGVAKLK